MSRKLKVYKQYGYNGNVVPFILLKGKWLKAAGFDSGTPITVTSTADSLIITRREMTDEELLEQKYGKKELERIKEMLSDGQ